MAEMDWEGLRRWRERTYRELVLSPNCERLCDLARRNTFNMRPVGPRPAAPVPIGGAGDAASSAQSGLTIVAGAGEMITTDAGETVWSEDVQTGPDASPTIDYGAEQRSDGAGTAIDGADSLSAPYDGMDQTAWCGRKPLVLGKGAKNVTERSKQRRPKEVNTGIKRRMGLAVTVPNVTGDQQWEDCRW
jgi:hypothetical protein